MTKENSLPSPNPLDPTIDTALARVLRPPSLPSDFRSRLDAALTRQGELEQRVRARLEFEHGERLAQLDAGFIRLRRRTLGTVIGAAFAAGAAGAVAMPWFKATFGSSALWIVPMLGALVGLAIGIGAWLRRVGYASPLDVL